MKQEPASRKPVTPLQVAREKARKPPLTITSSPVPAQDSAPKPPAPPPTPPAWLVGTLPDPVAIAAGEPPHKKGYKPTVKELRARYDIVAQLVGVKTRTQIHDFCATAWGICWRTSEEYASRAREMIMESANTTKQEMRARNYRLYCAVIADPTASHCDKLKAIAGIRAQFGLDAPQQVRMETSGPGGGPIKTEVKVKEPIDYSALQRVADEFFGTSQEDGRGQPVHPSPATPETGVLPINSRT